MALTRKPANDNWSRYQILLAIGDLVAFIFMLGAIVVLAVFLHAFEPDINHITGGGKLVAEARR